MPQSHHDALVKSTFSQVEHAAAFLRSMLPPELAARCDWSSLTLVPGSFIDEALRDTRSDLLYTVRIHDRTACLYLLFEHQSTFDPLMAWRLLAYMVRVWEAFLKDHPRAERLPAIVPLVLHHSESGWKRRADFESLLDLDAETFMLLAPFVPRFRFLLDDISDATSEALRARALTALGRLVLWCLRNARTPDDLLATLRGWAGVVREVHQAPHGAAALAVVWRYIVLISKRTPEETVALLIEAIPEEKESIVTAGEQLIERGRQEGLAKGRKEGLKEGQAEMLLKQLRLRFGALPEEAALKVYAADAATLERWAEQVLTARSLAEVLEPVTAAPAQR
jgi:predicted transposase YdaD